MGACQVARLTRREHGARVIQPAEVNHLTVGNGKSIVFVGFVGERSRLVDRVGVAANGQRPLVEDKV